MKDSGLTALETKVFRLQAVTTRALSCAMLFCQFCLIWKDHLVWIRRYFSLSR